MNDLPTFEFKRSNFHFKIEISTPTYPENKEFLIFSDEFDEFSKMKFYRAIKNEPLMEYHGYLSSFEEVVSRKFEEGEKSSNYKGNMNFPPPDALDELSYESHRSK